MEAGGIGVTHGIEPVHGHFFGVRFGGEEAVDDFFVSGGAWVGEKGVEVGGERWEAGEIESDAAEEGALVCLGSRLEADFGEPGFDEGVDRIALWPLDRLVGPMSFVDGSFGDPAANCVFLLDGQIFVNGRRRHDARCIFMENPLDDL